MEQSFIFQNHFECDYSLVIRMNPSFELKNLDEEETTDALVIRNRYGRLIPLLRDEKGEPRFILGPHYPIFLTAFLFSLVLLTWMIYFYFDKYSLIWKILVISSSSCFLLSYLWMGLSKPGVMVCLRKTTEIERESDRYCSVCDLVREGRTEHCQMCDVCIAGFDHHCPWVGKCVGRGNISGFYFFLVSTFGNLVVVFVATASLNLENQIKAGHK